MLELPEIAQLARQADQTLKGKRIVEATRGSNPHKWLFFNKEETEFGPMLAGATVTVVTSHAKWLQLWCEPGLAVSFNEMGGQIRFAESVDSIPMKWHFLLRFEDDSCLYAMVQGWGFVEIGLESEHQTDARPAVLGDGFDRDFFRSAVANMPEREKKSVKALITGGFAGVGLGNGYLHDVLFYSRIRPTRKVADLSATEIDDLFDAVVRVTHEAIACGGRDVERDLFGKTGGYRPVLDKRMIDQPCPCCTTPIKKISYMGGSCYFCPDCQI